MTDERRSDLIAYAHVAIVLAIIGLIIYRKLGGDWYL